jgi:hypothetical protein
MAGHRLLGAASTAVLAGTLFDIALAIPAHVLRQTPSDPFAPIDPQNWVSGLVSWAAIIDADSDFVTGESGQHDMGAVRCTT